MEPTQYQDINEILHLLKGGLINILGNSLIGLYLTGSLTYGDFDRGSSDIDFLAVLNRLLSKQQRREVEKLHSDIGRSYPEWHKRIEGSYITKKMLLTRERPKQSRPYVNAGKVWDLPYGNEWLLNLHVLYECGVALFGPGPKNLIGPVDISVVREASRQNLLGEWEPKLKNPAPFKSNDYDSSHLQAYAILTMCRILYTAHNKSVVSKRVAAEWAKRTYGKWRNLIEKAESWKHGKKLNSENKIKEFIKFVISETETSSTSSQ